MLGASPVEVKTPAKSARRQPDGRLVGAALIAALVAIVAYIAIGLAVGHSAESDLLQARMTIHESIVDQFVQGGLLPLEGSETAYAELDEAVRLRLLGGETVRVKLWAPDGTIMYSDATSIVGQRLDLEASIRSALEGSSQVEFEDPDAVENITEQGLGPLIEFYLPVKTGGVVSGVFEIYEASTSFSASLGEIRRNVWSAVGVGLAAVLIAIGSVVGIHARSMSRRKRQVEVLLGETLSAGDEERRRIVGALHDDIGQPLYRVLYGLEGCLNRVDEIAVRQELAHLRGIVGQIEASLRGELRLLNAGLIEGDGLTDALERLATAAEEESGISVSLRMEQVPAISATAATALFRTAQEAVINTRKHANSSSITIDLRAESTGAAITIIDDGGGWSGREGLGLSTSRERLVALEGRFDVARRTGQRGTVVTGWVPCVAGHSI